MVHVVAGPVWQDHVGQAEVFLHGLAFLDRLEAAGVAERRLLLVVPPDAAQRPCIGVDQKRGGQDRVEVAHAGAGDAVLGLDAHDLGDGHLHTPPAAAAGAALPGTLPGGYRLQVLACCDPLHLPAFPAGVAQERADVDDPLPLLP